MNRDFARRNQFYRGPLPRFQPPTMARHRQEPMDMSQFGHSLESPSVSHPEQRYSYSLNYEVNHESGGFDVARPNRVLSGNRNLHRTFTGVQGNFDGHANKIVAKLEEDEALMDDTPVSEQLRKEALRDLPQCLTMKRCVKHKLSKSVSQKSKRRPISFWKRVKYRSSITFSKFVSSLKNFNYFELWHGTLKDIEGHFGSGYASYFKFLRWLFVMNFAVTLLTIPLLVVPQIIFDASGENGSAVNTKTFEFKDIFIGHGSFEETVLYYGHYTNNSVELVPHLIFDMPAAYFSVIVVIYLISFIALAVSVAESYRRNFIETEGGLENVFANRLLCGWDFGIATKEAAELKSSSIYNELKELLSEQYENNQERTLLYKFWTYSIQIIVNILVLLLLVGVGWVTWLLLDEYSYKQQNDAIILTTIIINLIMMIFPTIFTYISKYEDYRNPRTALYITLVRTFLLGSVIVGVIVTFWLIKADYEDTNGVTDCWENRLGAEIYRLILFDFLFSVILSPLIDIAWPIIQYFRGHTLKSEFNIAKHTLNIIFNQGLFWVGFMYSPILPAIVTLKMFIIWYVREWCMRKLCSPPKRSWKAAQAQTWFMMMIFVSILLIIAVHGYTVKSIGSSNCGPFKSYEYIYEIVTNAITDLEQNQTWDVIMNVTKPGGVVLIMIALGILVYYVKEQASAHREKVYMLREMLVWMAKDKKEIVRWYNKYARGELDPKVHADRFKDPCKTLPNEYFDDHVSSVDEDDFSARYQAYS